MPLDNLAPPVDNADPQAPPVAPPVAPPANTAFAWKKELPADFANAPTLKKFADDKQGFVDAIQSHLTLEKLLGYEKVPIPKGKDDAAAWSIFGKALGIPEKADGYALPDVEMPEGMKGITFDKTKFAEVVHANKLTPDAAKGVWSAYTEMTKQAYAQAVKAQQEKVTGLINQMRGEWGDAYQSKVELGQMVINKFSTGKEMTDYLTATLSGDPNGIKFLAMIGDQFAENKIGEFKYQRHSLTPDEAQAELDSIRRDSNHPYSNEKAPAAERARAIDHVNTLIGVARRKGQA